MAAPEFSRKIGASQDRSLIFLKIFDFLRLYFCSVFIAVVIGAPAGARGKGGIRPPPPPPSPHKKEKNELFGQKRYTGKNKK